MQMPMQMGFRWYGEENDLISLSEIRQIPGVSTIVWALHNKLPGEIWQPEEIEAEVSKIRAAGFNADVVESVNVHDDIKIGLPSRDLYIENYIQTIRNLAPFGVKVICYNFMPVFDWTRTNLFHKLEDGSTALYYEAALIKEGPRAVVNYMLENLNGMTFPGWEPERMEKLEELFAKYRPVTKEKLWENLQYFLEKLMPVCRECDIKMAIHMDDPPWDIFGLPRLMTSAAAVDRYLSMVDDPYNCLALCSGSLNADPRNRVAPIVRKHCDRIAFAHIRNVKHFPSGDFSEVSHRDCDGDTGIIEILQAYHECGFEGYIRPDHGRHLWNEGPGTVRPGYGLYDRAMGIMYMLGVWDLLEREKNEREGGLELSAAGLKNRAAWLRKGYSLPEYDREAMIERTKAAPAWVHFGAGNIFKSLQGMAAQRLLNAGVMDRGIIAVERMDRGEKKYDDLSVIVTLKANGTVEKNILGAVAETCYLYGGEERLREIFRAPSLQLATFTITEKGYSITGDDVKADLAASPEDAQSYMGRVAALLYERWRAGAYPIAMVSTDNCSHNGDKLRDAMIAFAEAWGDEGFLAYVSDKTKVSFPWTMIDKITPSPDMTVGAMLEADGLEGFVPVRNARGTVKAPFVNAEESEYLVLEDSFPNGRPPLEQAGFYFTARETVDQVERMKVCTCLNPLHTALAVFGCLLGFTKISDEMQDADLCALVNQIGYKEGLPVVTDPGIIRPQDFIDTVVNVRIPNPFMPDTPQRIATDTSQKLPIRFGETVKAYLRSDTLDVQTLRGIPLVYAGWLRYLMAVDDAGKAFEPSPDPLLQKAQAFVSDMKLGEEPDVEALRGLLSDASIFGVDLYEAGLAERVCDAFKALCAGPGAVRGTLQKIVSEA